MADYVFNRLTFNCSTYRFKAILYKVCGVVIGEDDSEFVLFFDKIIPSPKTKEECVSKFGNEYVLSDDGTNWFNWKKWCNDFLGSCADAFDTEYNVKQKLITFNSEYTSPKKIVQKLSEMFSVEIKLEYAEAFGHNTGIITYKDGVEMSSHIPDDFSKEAYEMSAEMYDLTLDELSDLGIYKGE